MIRIFIVLALSSGISYCAVAQINQRSLDSLTRSIDSSRKALQAWQDSFNKRQDSIYRSATRSVEIDQNMRNITKLMLENKKREDERKKQAYIRIGIGIVLMVFLVITLLRRRKKRTDITRL